MSLIRINGLLFSAMLVLQGCSQENLTMRCEGTLYKLEADEIMVRNNGVWGPWCGSVGWTAELMNRAGKCSTEGFGNTPKQYKIVDFVSMTFKANAFTASRSVDCENWPSSR